MKPRHAVSPQWIAPLALAACLALAASSTRPAWASGRGGREGGGGNAERSTPDEIKAALKRIKDRDLSYAWERIARHLDSITDGDALEAFRMILGPQFKYFEPDPESERRLQAVFSDIDDSTYGFQDEPCKDDRRQHKEGHATIGDRGGLICFSTSLLTRVPPGALESTLLALAAHEHSHHLGASEEQAVAIQRYFRQHPSVVTHNPIRGQFGERYFALQSATGQLEKELAASATSASATRLCSSIGALEADAESLYKVMVIDESEGISARDFPDAAPASKETRAQVAQIYADAFGMPGFCGEPVDGEGPKLFDESSVALRPTLAEGEVAKLKERLALVSPAVEKLMEAVDVY